MYSLFRILFKMLISHELLLVDFLPLLAFVPRAILVSSQGVAECKNLNVQGAVYCHRTLSARIGIPIPDQMLFCSVGDVFVPAAASLPCEKTAVTVLLLDQHDWIKNSDTLPSHLHTDSFEKCLY